MLPEGNEEKDLGVTFTTSLFSFTHICSNISGPLAWLDPVTHQAKLAGLVSWSILDNGMKNSKSVRGIYVFFYAEQWKLNVYL